MAPAYSNMDVSILSSNTYDLTMFDTMSTDYGTHDGFSLCGDRSYALSYEFEGSPIS